METRWPLNCCWTYIPEPSADTRVRALPSPPRSDGHAGTLQSESYGGRGHAQGSADRGKRVTCHIHRLGHGHIFGRHSREPSSQAASIGLSHDRVGADRIPFGQLFDRDPCQVVVDKWPDLIVPESTLPLPRFRWKIRPALRYKKEQLTELLGCSGFVRVIAYKLHPFVDLRRCASNRDGARTVGC